MDKENIYLSLTLNEPIVFKEVGKINIPTIKEIYDYGFDNFKRLLLPFLISLDLIEDNDLYDNIFDYIYDNTELLSVLLYSLSMYFKTNEIKAFKNRTIQIDDNKDTINKDNFDELADVILLINNQSKIVVEKPPEFKNERQKTIWENLQEGRKRKALSNAWQLSQIINFVKHSGENYISSDVIKNMNLWELYTAYEIIINKISYNYSFEVFLVSGDDKLISNNWIDSIKNKN